LQPGHGSAKAWVSHLDMIKHIVASGLSTALILEDDVDWDINIKEQMSLISDNIRNLTLTPDTDQSPFGYEWDVLWLGHCGEIVDEDSRLYIEYRDDSTIDASLYSGWSKPLGIDKIQPQHRRIQSAAVPVCSFGFAVTAIGAQKVSLALGKGADEAFDVALQHQCRHGTLRCITINPEIMHHYEPPREEGYISPVREGDGHGHSTPDNRFEHLQGATANVVKSARCRALFNMLCLTVVA